MRWSSALSAPRVALLLGVLLHAGPRAAEAAEPPATSTERSAFSTFLEGQRAFESGDYLLAARAFEAAYQLEPHPDVLWNAARAWERAGEIARAANRYERYLREAPAGARDRDSALQAVSRLATKLGRIEVVGPGTVDIAVDEHPLDRCDEGVDRCLDATHALNSHERRIVRCDGAGFGPGSNCVVSGDTARCGASACAIEVDSILACAENTLSICDPNLKQKYEIACAATGSTCVTSPTRVSVTTTASIPVSACTSHDNELTLAAVCSAAAGDGAVSCSTDSASMVVCNRLVRFKSKGGVTTVGGVEALYHCQRELGWSCVESADGATASCARPDAECTPDGADVNRCDGDVIDICLAGHRFSVDCAAVGAACHGASGAARCELAP